MRYLIGLDIGTSNIKAVLFDETGNPVCISSQKTAVSSPHPRYMEQDMDQLWDAVVFCLNDLTHQYPDLCRLVDGIGLSGQGEGLWLLDQDGQPVQPAILWNDGRSAETVASFSTQELDTIRQITYTSPNTSSTLVQLKWTKNNHPDILANARTCFFCKDWIRYKLTGEIFTERTDTSVTLMDMPTQALSEELLTLAGIGECINLFPPMLQSTGSAGSLSADAARITGLPAGIPVAAGALDVTATCLGVGAVTANDLFLILGTTACTGLVKESHLADPDQGRFLLHPDSTYMIKIMATMAGTPNIDWMAEAIAFDVPFDHIEESLHATKPGSGGVIYLPYISPSGERYPFYHPSAKAGFFGITSHIRRDQLIRSVFEGVALSVKDCLQGETTAGRIHIAGGGSKSNAWCQIMADCTGHQIIRYRGDEFGAKGAAILAGVCAGWKPTIQDMARSFCTEDRLFDPDPASVTLYDDLYSMYADLRKSQWELWHHHQSVLEKYHL